SAIRQFGNSAIRQFGNSLNRSLTLAFLLALPLSAALTVTVRAQWTGAVDNDIGNSANWEGNDINFRFVYSGSRYDYTLLANGTMTGNEKFIVTDTTGFPTDINTLKGDYVWSDANNFWGNTFVRNINTTTGEFEVSRGRKTNLGTTPDTFYASNYAPDFDIPTLSFSAGATTINTGTYDARQLRVGAIVSGAGFAEGTYITGILNSGAFTVSAPTTDAAASVTGTMQGLRNYGKALNLTYSGTITTTNDFVLVNTVNDSTNIAPVGTAKIIFDKKNTLFSVTQGNVSDTSFVISGNLQFNGNLTVNNGGGYAPAAFGNQNNGLGQYNGQSTPMLHWDANTVIAGDFTKIGSERMKSRGGYFALDGGKFNILDSYLMIEYSNISMTAGNERIRGASEINIANAASSYRTAALYLNGDAIRDNAAENIAVPEDLPINLYGGVLGTQGNRKTADPNFFVRVGDVNLQSGRNYLAFLADRNWGMSLGTLNRNNGATLGLYGIKDFWSATNQLVIRDDAAIVNDLVGTVYSGTVSGTTTTNLKILPWATASAVALNSNNAPGGSNEMVTYASGSDKGFRILAATEYKNTIADAIANGMTDNNVSLLASEDITNATVNALRTGTNSTITLTAAASSTLTMSSGLMISSGQININNSNLTIYTGSRAFVVMGSGALNFYGATYKNDIAADSKEIGLVAAAGNVSVGSGQYGGTVLIESGVLTAMAASSIPVTSDVRIDTRASLSVNARAYAASLAGSGTVYFTSQNVDRTLSIGSTAATGTNNVVFVRDGGFIAPGDVSGPMQAGTLYFGQNVAGLTFEAGSILQLDLGADGVSDTLAIYNTTDPTKTLTFNDGAIIQLSFLDGYTPQENDTWSLAAGFTTISEATGDWSKVLLQDAGGNPLDDDFTLSLGNGSLLLTSIVPEPSTWLLLTIGAGLLVLLRRRR
ncbi:MAG: PEP-CTERM sorting domain-containing protein, partial [Verrucomicrobiales bacterium]|nr:PEP-CTERM sorting domain-containing protein [Verrucomicrobiales bacterium]